MRSKNEMNLYVNVYGLEDMKALNSELEHSFNLLTGVVEYIKYLKHENGIDQDTTDLIVKKIAEKLVLSEVTVKSHMNSIFKKLKVKNRTQAVLLAMQMNLTEN